MKQAAGSAGTTWVLRLQPGEDVRPVLSLWAIENGITAGCVVSAVGSLTQAHLRYANRADGIMTTADLEVCSLSGTLSTDGLHLHLSVADRDGRTLGGHLLPGCIVRTTLEVVVMSISGVRMQRKPDPATTYDELDPTEVEP